MGIRNILCIAVVSLFTTVSAQAKKPCTRKHKADLRLLTAYTQHVPYQDIHFILVWQQKQYPETFFWRGENGWLPCKMEKAHKDNAGKAYVSENISAGDIHKGDTLMLTPVAGGRFPMPEEIPMSMKNTLFYKFGGSKWMSFFVKKVAK